MKANIDIRGLNTGLTLKAVLATVLVTLLFLAASYFSFRFGRSRGYASGYLKGSEPRLEVNGDTILVHDTVRVKEPVFVACRTVDTMYVRTDSTVVIRDTAYIAIPREQRTYEGESYRAYVSGYQPKLDSINVFSSIVYLETEAERISKDVSRWGFGVVVGPSFIVTPNGDVKGGLGAAIGVRYSF